MAKRKKVKCRLCGERYAARTLRCPACEAPNPHAAGSGVSATDRWVGVILIILGVLIAFPSFWFLYWALRFGGIRVKAVTCMLAIIPVGTVFNGILLVNGVHPKDFYSWWENLSDLTRGLIWAALAIVAACVLLFFMFGGADFGDNVEGVD